MWEYPLVIILYLTQRQRHLTEILNPAQPWKWTVCLLQNNARITVSHLNKKTVELLCFCLALHTANNIIWTCPSTAKRPTTALASISRVAAAAAANTSGSSLSSMKSLLLLLLISTLRFRCSASTKGADVYRERNVRLCELISITHSWAVHAATSAAAQLHFCLWEKHAPRTNHLLCPEGILIWTTTCKR